MEENDDVEVVVISCVAAHERRASMAAHLAQRLRRVRWRFQAAATLDTHPKFAGCDARAAWPRAAEQLCALSHLQAVAAAALGGTRFTVVLEDDARLHRDFEAEVLRLAAEAWPQGAHAVQLGWVPTEAPSAYAARATATAPFLRHSVLGLQAYMLRRDALRGVRAFPLLLGAKCGGMTAARLVDALAYYAPHCAIAPCDFVADKFVPRVLGDVVALWPPLAIESGAESTLGHANETQFWANFWAYMATQGDATYTRTQFTC